jgi:ribosomal RNA-processing protein 36
VVFPEEVRTKLDQNYKPDANRDPRFSKLSGKFNVDLFRKSYDFMHQHRADEIARLKKQLAAAKNRKKGTKRGGAKHRNIPAPTEEEQAEWKEELTRLQQESAKEKGEEAATKAKSARRKAEEEAVSKGKKPFYLKRSELKKIEMKERFEHLQSEGRLKKVLQKKRKKNKSKESKSMPRQRRKLS